MKELAAFANDQEVVLMQGALKRGEDADAHLTVVKDRIAQIVTASRQYKSLQLPDVAMSSTSSCIAAPNAAGSQELSEPRRALAVRDKDDNKSVESSTRRAPERTVRTKRPQAPPQQPLMGNVEI